MNAHSPEPVERMIFSLRALYDRHGYSRYKMNKFEEYDLYAKNKDFLISDGVITFTDTNGRLMALKPDVTLSIVKNTKDRENGIQKLYYNENVYRVSKGTRSFREITQVGLEALGSVDEHCIYEVLSLAAKSLSCTGKNCVLEISHLGLLSDVLRYAGVPEEETGSVLHFIGEKNLHELTALCASLSIPEDRAALLRRVASVYGTPGEVLPEIRSLLAGVADETSLERFSDILTALEKTEAAEMLRIDFSVVSDTRYYNGFVFKGFAEGIPTSILSGGQYDRLMAKMKRSSRAIGFAVYLDMLQEYGKAPGEYDIDTLILYDDPAQLGMIEAEAEKYRAKGESALVQPTIPMGLRFRWLVSIQNGEVKTVEDHA